MLSISHQFNIQKELELVDFGEVYNSENLTYKDFRKTLSPNFLKVWWDIFLGYLGIALVVAFLIHSTYFKLGIQIICLAVGSCAIGFFVAYIQLFIHEAAHFRIAGTRRYNDLLANIFVGSLAGLYIKTYRKIHWKHHTNHGNINDTEHSYFDAPNLRFILEILTGIRVLKTVLSRKTSLKTMSENSKTRKSTGDQLMILTTITLHLGFTIVMYFLGFWLVSLAWIIGVGVFFPFFGALRQILEHRKPDAQIMTDYSTSPHGKFTRLFGNDIFSKFFGGAGFNKHLIHHWDPGISYTNFPMVEKFLYDTQLAEHLSMAKSNYVKTFILLFRN